MVAYPLDVLSKNASRVHQGQGVGSIPTRLTKVFKLACGRNNKKTRL